MTSRTALNLNLASRPLRNRRLFRAAAWALVAAFVCLAGLAVFVFLKYGGEASRLRASMAETRQIQAEAAREERRLRADIDREEKLSGARVDLVNAIIRKKTFSWTGLLSELERALPDASYITSLSPAFASGGGVALQMRVSSRTMDDITAFITALNAQDFEGIQLSGEQRDRDGRYLMEIRATYERPL
ncbi:MAG TPA: hypothetical protein ENO03_08125 [Candidatus Aminicenantes bacterium]|nr:hypothetical protein [Candidatus Aminicenantes bacterium]